MNNNNNFINSITNELPTHSKIKDHHYPSNTSLESNCNLERIKELHLTRKNQNTNIERHIIIDHKNSNGDANKGEDEAFKKDINQPINLNMRLKTSESMNWINKQNDRDMSPSSFNLQEIIETYGENSEIFQLILISKVEEDRRRIEEAKLKQKKIDFFVSNKEQLPPIISCQNCNSLGQGYNLHEMTTPIEKMSKKLDDHSYSRPISENRKYLPRKQDNAKKKIKRNDNKPRVLGLSPEEFYKDVDHSSSTAYSVQQNETTSLQTKRHKSLTQLFSSSSLSICSPLQDKSVDSHNFQQALQSSVALPINRRNSVDGSSNRASDTLPPIGATFLMDEQTQDGLGLHAPFMPSERPSKMTSAPLTSYHNTSYPTLPTLDSFETSIMNTLPFNNNHGSTSSADSSSRKELNMATLNLKESSLQTNTVASITSRSMIGKNKYLKKLALPPNIKSSNQSQASVTTRRRREMQPITMIIETKEFPYNDDYVWKNNGNTTHKSTGQKSIYYKCSNSNAGCSVNKTVSFRSNGEYLIKYRGFHLHECCKIKRVMAM